MISKKVVSFRKDTIYKELLIKIGDKICNGEVVEGRVIRFILYGSE